MGSFLHELLIPQDLDDLDSLDNLDSPQTHKKENSEWENMYRTLR